MSTLLPYPTLPTCTCTLYMYMFPTLPYPTFVFMYSTCVINVGQGRGLVYLSVSLISWCLYKVRVELLLELALSAKRAVLLTGPRGSGKTTLCKHFLQARGDLFCVCVCVCVCACMHACVHACVCRLSLVR